MAEEKTSEQQLQEKLAAAEAAIKRHQAENDALRAANGKAEQELLDANQLIDDLNQSAAPADVPVVKLGKEQYRVVVPQFNYDGKIYVAADVASNSPLLKELVKIEAGVVELVEAE